MVSYAAFTPRVGVGKATSRARWGWVRPAAENTVHPFSSRRPVRFTSDSTRPTLPAAASHACAADSTAGAGAAWLPTADDET